MSELTLGIIGGMGPEATVEFMRRLIARTPARDDSDHLRMLVDNNPKVPSRIKAIIQGEGEDPAPVLAAMAAGLQAAGAQLLAIPCNTAHYYLPDIRAAVSVPVLDVVELTARHLRDAVPASAIGMLASPAVQQIGLFDRVLAAHGLQPVYPNALGQRQLLQVIQAVKADGAGPSDIPAYHAVARSLQQDGAAALLVACTELSILQPPDTTVPVIDTLEVLVGKTIAACAGKRA